MLESEKLTRICHLREAQKEDSKVRQQIQWEIPTKWRNQETLHKCHPGPQEVTEEQRFKFICKCPVLPVVLPMYGPV